MCKKQVIKSGSIKLQLETLRDYYDDQRGMMDVTGNRDKRNKRKTRNTKEWNTTVRMMERDGNKKKKKLKK